MGRADCSSGMEKMAIEPMACGQWRVREKWLGDGEPLGAPGEYEPCAGS